MREHISWGIMFIVGLLLIAIGFQGALGKVLACVLVPSEVVVVTPDASPGVF